MAKKEITEEELLRRALDFWKHQFKMVDWDISLEFVLRSGFSDFDRAGEVEIDSEHRKALIKVVSKEEESHPSWEVDRKKVLAHEFSHILLWVFPIPAGEGIDFKVYEQTVNIMAEGIRNMTDWDSLKKKKKG